MSKENNPEEEERLRKLEREGYLFFQRCGEPEWEDINSFYAYSSHEHSVVNNLPEEVDNVLVNIDELNSEYDEYLGVDEQEEEDL